MTPKEAKALSLEIWEYLAAHPKIDSKGELPENIQIKVKGLLNKCALCELFKNGDELVCPQCPIGDCGDNSPSDKWHNPHLFTNSKNSLTAIEMIRQEAAEETVALIRAWEPEEAKSRLEGRNHYEFSASD